MQEEKLTDTASRLLVINLIFMEGMLNRSYMPENEVNFSRGLEGVIASQTKIGYIDGLKGHLVYRGYEINSLVENSTYEETAYLLLHGRLPTRSELDDFTSKLKERSSINKETYDVIRRIAGLSHTMSSLRTAVSYIGTHSKLGDKTDYESQEEMGISIIAKMPTIVAAIKRAVNNEDFIEPDPSLSYTENFLYQSFGERKSKEVTRILDSMLLLHADHGMNASTFASMVVISTLSDMYSAITAGISALKGPLHGGANERALKMIMSIGSPEKVPEAIGRMLESKEKIMGFGHRVYKVYDPRAKIVKTYADQLTKGTPLRKVYETAIKIEDYMIERLGSKGIFPNVDFYSGIAYKAIGFEPELFTPIFAVSRITGWVARDLEYLTNNRIFRPRSEYIGESEIKSYIPIERR